MSVENAINNLIKELQNHRGKLTDGDKSGTPSSPTSSTGTGNTPTDKSRGGARERLTDELDQKGIKAAVVDTLKMPLRATREAFLSEIKDGLSLDETDIRILLDPLLRQVTRFSDFKKQTAEVFREFGIQSGQMSERFGASRNEMEKFGETSEKLYGSAAAGFRTFKLLSANFGGFAGVQAPFRTSIGESVMAMEKLGFSTEDVSKVLDNATRSLGMNGDQANQTILRLAKLRQEFNVSAREITQNYITAQDRLIYNTGKVDRIFAQLQSRSRRSGVEFSTLIDKFGEGFDTFEGAAAKAGGLNALLGGNVFNSLELLEMDEAERVGTIVDRIRGKVDVNALVTDKFNLKAVANQLGLSPDQTRRLLLGETSVAKAMETAIPSGASAVNKANGEMTNALRDLQNVFEDARGPYSKALLGFANDIATGAGSLFESINLGFTAFGAQGVLNAINLTALKLPSDDSTMQSAEDLSKRVATGASGSDFQNNLSLQKLMEKVKGLPGADIQKIQAMGASMVIPLLAKLGVLNETLVAASAGGAAIKIALDNIAENTGQTPTPGTVTIENR